MKILICIRRLDFGGIETLESALAIDLNKDGIKTDIAYQYDINFENHGIAEKKLINLGVNKVHRLKAKSLLGKILSPIRMYNILRKEKYDAIITCNNFFNIITGFTIKLTQAKHIIAFHSEPPTMGFIFKLISSYFAKKANACYGISNVVVNKYIEDFSLSENKISCIYNSFHHHDVKKPALENIRDELKIKKNAKIILIVGRVTKLKGGDLSLKHIGEYLNDWNAHVLFAGSNVGDDKFKIELTKISEFFKINERVHYLGLRNDILQLMKQSNVLLHLPSEEGFGLVLLEAISSSLPIIASNVGGIPEVLFDTPYITYNRNDKSSITAAIQYYLYMDEHQKKTITDKASIKICFFSQENRVNKIKLLLNDVI